MKSFSRSLLLRSCLKALTIIAFIKETHFCHQLNVCCFNFISAVGLYIGCSDVTEFMATIRSPFCGYNLAYIMCEVKGRKIYRVISIIFDPLVC